MIKTTEKVEETKSFFLKINKFNKNLPRLKEEWERKDSDHKIRNEREDITADITEI